MSGEDRTSDEAVFELVLDSTAAVRVRPRFTGLVGLVIVVGLVAAAVAMMGGGGSSDADARIAGFRAAMVERVSFAYELDLTAEDVTSLDGDDIVPGGPLELLQIEGKVAAADRYSMVVTHSEGVDEMVRVGDDLYQRGATFDDDDDSWWRDEYEVPEPPSVDDVRAELEAGSEMDAVDARLLTIAGLYLHRVILDPSQLPSLLADIDPQAADDSVADAFDDQVPVVGSVPFPLSYADVLPDVAPMQVTVDLGPDGHPGSARFEIGDVGGLFVAEVRFSEWGGEFEIVAPADVKDAFDEVGTAIEDSIEDSDDSEDSVGDEPDTDDGDVLVAPGGLDPSMAVWIPTNVPSDFQLVDLQPADVSGDDGCNGVFAVWMASERPVADWVSQDTPESDNSQLLTVMSVPAACKFVSRTPLFEPGPFGDVPTRRNGDQWEVLLDDTWVVQLDSVVVTWDELVAMVQSLDMVSLRSLQEQLG